MGNVENSQSVEPGEETAPTMGSLRGMENRPREIVRLFQCRVCSRILRNPVALPCGISICRGCVPPISHDHEKQHCSNCDETHLECPTDYILKTTVESALRVINNVNSEHDAAVCVWREGESKECAVTLPGGRIAATFDMADNGSLPRDTDLVYSPAHKSLEEIAQHDAQVLVMLKEGMLDSLSCILCKDILFSPFTTKCGHTFCEICLRRALDRSSTCPFCRTGVHTPELICGPGNTILADVLTFVYGKELEKRAEDVADSESAGDATLSMPIFVCTVSLPGQVTYLHIFEPRYRLMLRRVLEGNRRFGMVSSNRTGEPQGDLGDVHFMQYGTILEIESARWLDDGRCNIQSRGINKFKIRRFGYKDEYMVADIEPYEDVPLQVEQELEAEEIMPHQSIDNIPFTNWPTSTMYSVLLDCTNRFLQSTTPSWRRNALLACGNPPLDPRLLPYWLATVLPIEDSSKYRLIPERTVRGRLKIALGWMHMHIQIARQPWLARRARLLNAWALMGLLFAVVLVWWQAKMVSHVRQVERREL